MPRVTEKKANRDYPEAGIKKGDTYYTWKFYRGRKVKSLKYPRPSQLTQREDYGALREAQEAAEDMKWEVGRRSELAGEVGDVITSLEAARDAAQNKYDNLPDQWRDGDKGSNLDNFVSECDTAIAEAEDIRDELADETDSATAFDEITEITQITWPQEWE